MDDPSTAVRHVRMEDYRRVLAENLKAARRVLDLSQEALAHEADIDRTYVSGIERGKRNPSLNLIVRLAETLKTSPAALLTPQQDGVGPPTPSCPPSEGREAELRGTTHATLLRR